MQLIITASDAVSVQPTRTAHHGVFVKYSTHGLAKKSGWPPVGWCTQSMYAAPRRPTCPATHPFEDLIISVCRLALYAVLSKCPSHLEEDRCIAVQQAGWQAERHLVLCAHAVSMHCLSEGCAWRLQEPWLCRWCSPTA